MTMAEQMLVVILASALAVFLVLAIVLVILLIVIAKKLKNVASAAERTVENVEGFVANVQSALAPAAFGSFLLDIIGRAAGSHKRRKGDD